MDETPDAVQNLIDDELHNFELGNPHPSQRILELRTRHNTDSHISKLPVEIFVQIFLLVRNSVLTTTEWHQITHVCRHWRQLALDTSLLWTNPTDCPLEYTELILQRSKMTSLDIDFGYGSTTPLPAVTAIFKHSSRIRILCMRREDVIKHALQTVNSGEHQFARMEALHISCLDTADSQSYSVPDAFFQHPSVLRHLSLSIGRMQFNWAYLALPNLTSLYLGRMQLAQKISGDTLLRTLNGMTMLRTLHLDLSLILLPAAAQFSAAIHLSQLQYCALSGPYTPSLLLHIIMPHLQVLHIAFRHMDPADHLPLSTAISSAVSNGAFSQFRSISLGKTRVFIAKEYAKSGNLKLSSTFRLEIHVLISVMQPLLSRFHKLGNNISEASFDRDLLPADLIVLLRELPTLRQLTIKTGSNLESFAVALSAYSEDSIPLMQHLTTITLDAISFDAPGAISLSRFCDALVKRHSTGHGIKLLRLNGCTALSDHIRAQKLQEIDVRVEEEDGREPNQIR